VGLLQKHPRIFAIVGNATGAAQVCRKLTSYGMGNAKVAIGERLSYADEKISHGRAVDFQEISTDPLSVILLEWKEENTSVVTPGICDGEFLRDKVPMTKEEIRSISLSKLRLTKDAVIYDVGAGTGSVSVEMALMAVDGRVYAVEKKEEAVQLLHKNKEKFRADNLDIISGTAPEALKDLPVPTHAFIGGSSGNLREILQLLLEKNPEIRVVVNCITLETVAEALACVKNLPVEDVDIAQVNVAKGKIAGAYHLMMGLNPVYVISFTGAAAQE
jgi:precorrin-6Y C5,15-methyltransferase (decarboxylating)